MSRQQVANIVLIVLLVGGGIFAGFKITDLSQDLNELESQHATLQSSHNELQALYDSLESNYHSLESEYQSLESSYGELSRGYDSLVSTYETMRSEHEALELELSQLKTTNDELEAQNQELMDLLTLYESLPDNYYSVAAFESHPNTYEALCNFLLYDFALPRTYKLGVFDCSESAAYLEWALEIAGFDADIVVGPTPWDTESRHAWVIAHTEEYGVAIEATELTGYYGLMTFGGVPGIVYRDESPYWQNYYEGYDGVFGNIYQAVRHYGDYKEVNWWEGYWGFK
jgi:hypothetical protein